MNLIKITLLLVITGFLSGCANVFVAYPSRMQPVRSGIVNNQLKQAIKQVKTNKSTTNTQLTNIELGRLYQLNGQFEASQASYSKAIKTLQANQLKAKIEFSRIAENAGSLVLNPRVIPYRLYPYQAVILYGYQAINYFAMNDLTDALVSIRQGQAEQNWIKQNHQKELAAAAKAQKAAAIKLNYKKYPEYFSGTMDAAKGIKSTFENGFFDYLSAVFYLSDQDSNNAFISLKNALALSPNNQAIRQLLLQTLVMRGGNPTQLDHYLKAFGLSLAPAIPMNSGMVTIIFEQSLIPAIQSNQVNFPVLMGKQVQMVSFAMPVYSAPLLTPQPMKVSTGELHMKTALVANNYKLAAKSLESRYPMIILRQVMSSITKTGLAYSAQKQNAAAGIAAQFFNLVTTGADQRSWLTLPRYEQVWSAFLSQGKHSIQLNYLDQQKTVTIDVRHYDTTLIWVVETNGKLEIKTLPIKG